MEIKTTKQDITNSPKDLNELWAATSPIYHDDQLTDDESDHDLDVNIAIKAAACRDVTFIIGDYNDIMGKIDCGLRVIRYGIDVRVNADPKIFFDTLGWAVQGNEECQEFLQLYPDSLSYSHIQVCSLLEQIYVAVSEYIKHICLGKQYHQNYNFGYHCHFSFPQPTAFSTPPECMQLYQNQTTNSAHLNGVVGVNTNSAPKPVTNARRKTGRVKNQLREISRAKVVDSSPSVAEYDASAVQVQPMTGMDVARSLPSSSESVVAAANNNQGHAAR